MMIDSPIYIDIKFFIVDIYHFFIDFCQDFTEVNRKCTKNY